MAENLTDFYYEFAEPNRKLIIAGAAAAILLILILFVLLPIVSRPATGTLAITVRDEAGSAIAGAEVRVTGLQKAFSAKTDSAGALQIEGIALGTKLAVEVNKADYSRRLVSVVVAEQMQEESIILKSSLPPPSEVVVEFVGPDGRKVVNREVSAEFSCSTGTLLQQTRYTTYSGEITLTMPGGCGILNVKAVSPQLMPKNATIGSAYEVIRFSAEELPKGSAVIKVRDAERKTALEGIRVSILDSSGTLTGDAAYTNWGEAVFQLAAGSYSALVEDESLNYAPETVSFTVNPGRVANAEAELGKTVKAVLKFTVANAASGAKLAGATVFLRDDAGNLLGAKTTDENNLEASFALKDEGTYHYHAKKEGYLASDENSIEIKGLPPKSELVRKISIAPCSTSKCGIVRVRVIDEDKLPVENARVLLFNSETRSWAIAYGERNTDFNGYTTQPFSDVKAGSYFALAQKYPASGESAEFKVDPATINEIEMMIEIGEGTVIVRAVDGEALPVAFADVEIRGYDGSIIKTLSLDAEGTASLVLKADKRVYAVVRKKGYTSYTSVSKRIIKEQAVEITATLRKGITLEKPIIELEGIFSRATGDAAQNLSAGNSYIARFNLVVPSEKEYEELGAFIMVGQDASMEEDKIHISEANVPAAAQNRGKTFNPPLGPNGGETPATSSAKWAEMRWNREGIWPGIYALEIELYVEKSATPGYYLPLFYRAWAVEGSSYLRDPIDAELGKMQESAAKGELYAASHEKALFEGISETCGSEFCFGARVIDAAKGLYLTEPYRIMTFQDYNLMFSITNISQTEHSKAALTIRNSANAKTTDNAIEIGDYRIINADAEKFSGNVRGFETGPFSLGRFGEKKSASGEIALEAKELRSSGIQFSIVSEMQEVFEKSVMFMPYADTDLNLSLSAEVLPAFTALELTVRTEYEGGELDGIGIKDALIVITRTAPDMSETIQSAYTDREGNAGFIIPPSSPGTRLIIRAEKAGFGVHTIEKTIGTEVVSLNPEKIEITLNLTTKTETEKNLGITSLVQPTLKIADAKIGGRFMGLLNAERMNSYLRQFEGMRIGANEIKTISVLAALSGDAQLLNEPQLINARLIIDLNNLDDTATWVAELPVEITINLAEMPQNAPCIILSAAKWEDSTVESRAQLSFYIQNNCVTEQGREMSLENLQAKLEWGSGQKIAGNIEMTVSDPFTGTATTEVLQEALWTRLLNKLEPGVEYPATLRFIPKTGTLGERAQFKVGIDAQLLTNRGRQFVGSAPSSIDADIMIADIDQCISITPHPQEGIEIGRSEEEAEFEADVTECGALDIDIRFCGGSSGDQCRGGTSEGGLYIRPWQVDKLNGKTDPTRTIKVKRQSLPGFYGITVEARPTGGSWREITTIETVVKPEEGLYFELDKYDFTIIGDGATDSTIIYNEMVQEPVDVSASVCDWDSAVKNKNFNGGKALAAAVGAGALAGGMLYMMGPAVTGVLKATALAGACPPCFAVGAVIAVVVFFAFLVAALVGKDPCDNWHTATLNDYVINLAGTRDINYERYLPPDAADIILGERKINGEWKLEVTDFRAGRGRNGIQEVGLVFRNAGIKEQKAVYTVVTLSAVEHIHGDETHQRAAVRCRGGDFGNYWVNPANCNGAWDRKYYTQSFHLRFTTDAQTEALPKVGFDTQPCSSGNMIGRTGKGSLPRIKLNWGWKEPDGISWNNCDADNPDYIYCDATQFTIEVNKKLHRLYEFLEENDFELGCPGGGQTTNQQFNNQNSSQEIPPGLLGLKEINAQVQRYEATVNVTVKNRTPTVQNASVRISLMAVGEQSQSCIREVVGMASASESQISCSFEGLGDAQYLATAEISSTTTTLLHNNSIQALFGVGAERESGEMPCSIKTTETLYGVPAINRFIENNPNIKWTSAVDSKESLNKLLKFNAYLMKDSYSRDFLNDFLDYYTKTAFADTDSYFSSLKTDSRGKPYGFDRLFERGQIGLTGKYVQSSALPTAGLYLVEIAVYFGEENWRFFDNDGKPKASVIIVTYLLEEAYPNSPFYSMPFNGAIGIEGGEYDRQEYGTAYSNTNPAESVEINKGGSVKTHPSSKSNALASIIVSSEKELYRLNTSPESRGIILTVEKESAASGSIVFSPSHATPVIMRMTKSAPSKEAFAAFYSLLSGESRLGTGMVMNYWSGASSCLDFSGIPSSEAFYEKPDRAAKAEDGLQAWDGIYAIDWKGAEAAGDVQLRTIFYTNPRQDVSIHAKHPTGELEFLSPDERGQMIALNGISSMPYNNFAAGEVGAINSIADVFEMVEKGDACIINSGTKTRFFWNPQRIYAAKGAQRSIHAESESPSPDFNCIGQGS